MVEIPPPEVPADSKMVQVVAARVRGTRGGEDPLATAARARVRAKSGRWLLLYGTRLSGGTPGRTAVVIQPAAARDVAPLIAVAYGLSERECQITRLCLCGLSTKEISQALGVSPYTVRITSNQSSRRQERTAGASSSAKSFLSTTFHGGRISPTRPQDGSEKGPVLRAEPCFARRRTLASERTFLKPISDTPSRQRQCAAFRHRALSRRSAAIAAASHA
jgi:hypothetical protein